MLIYGDYSFRKSPVVDVFEKRKEGVAYGAEIHKKAGWLEKSGEKEVPCCAGGSSNRQNYTIREFGAEN